MATDRTFDQLRAENPSTDPVETPKVFEPHEAINSRIVFEPMSNQGHVRITARSENFDLLWGVIASPGTLSRHPVEVAFYDRLFEQAKHHIPSLVTLSGTDAISLAHQRVAQLRKCLDALEELLTPKKISDKTEKRASGIVPDLNDAFRLLDAWTSTEDEQ